MIRKIKCPDPACGVEIEYCDKYPKRIVKETADFLNLSMETMIDMLKIKMCPICDTPIKTEVYLE